jgi:NADH dehydrogenase FAD-containing subunit
VPAENKVILSNGREYTYKALVVTPGFDHQSANIEGLTDLEATHEIENVYTH